MNIIYCCINDLIFLFVSGTHLPLTGHFNRKTFTSARSCNCVVKQSHGSSPLHRTMQDTDQELQLPFTLNLRSGEKSVTFHHDLAVGVRRAALCAFQKPRGFSHAIVSGVYAERCEQQCVQ